MGQICTPLGHPPKVKQQGHSRCPCESAADDSHATPGSLLGAVGISLCPLGWSDSGARPSFPAATSSQFVVRKNMGSLNLQATVQKIVGNTGQASSFGGGLLRSLLPPFFVIFPLCLSTCPSFFLSVYFPICLSSRLRTSTGFITECEWE